MGVDQWSAHEERVLNAKCDVELRKAGVDPKMARMPDLDAHCFTIFTSATMSLAPVHTRCTCAAVGALCPSSPMAVEGCSFLVDDCTRRVEASCEAVFPMWR
jgi:hypothetical protein